MTILGFDFSSTRKSVAVIEVTGDGTIAKSASASEHAERTTRPAALSAQVLEEAGIVRESIDRIAVGLGPASGGATRHEGRAAVAGRGGAAVPAVLLQKGKK